MYGMYNFPPLSDERTPAVTADDGVAGVEASDVMNLGLQPLNGFDRTVAVHQTAERPMGGSVAEHAERLAGAGYMAVHVTQNQNAA